MAIFPTGFSDLAPSRTSKVMGDNGTQNGNFTIQQILDLLNMSDLPPGTAAGDYFQWDGTQWVFANDATVAELAAAAVLADTNLFAIDQGGAQLVKATMTQLYTYMLGKMRSTGVQIEDVTGTTYEFSAADRNKIKRFTSNAAVTATVPTGLPVGYGVGWIQQGTGVITFTSTTGAGQTIQSAAGLKSGGQYGRGSLLLHVANTWNLSGYTVV